jgi:uncharacterized membrane protein
LKRITDITGSKEAAMTNVREQESFPLSAGILFGLGLGGFFEGIILHQVLAPHLTSAGYLRTASAISRSTSRGTASSN